MTSVKCKPARAWRASSSGAFLGAFSARPEVYACRARIESFHRSQRGGLRVGGQLVGGAVGGGAGVTLVALGRLAYWRDSNGVIPMA